MNFVGTSKIAIFISIFIILLGIVSLVVKKGPNYGIDFAGGLSIQLKFSKPFKVDDIRSVLKTMGLGNSIIQEIGKEGNNEVLIRAQKTDTGLDRLSNKITKAITASDKFSQNNFEILKVDMVGPRAGKILRKKGVWACFWAVVVMLIYVTYRFELPYALGGIVALFHDLLITIGIFSILNKEFDIGILAALLTILGYSINDTIVLFDRVRENLKFSKKESYNTIINNSINQTISRTVLTSITTLLPLTTIFFFGGEVLHDISFALLIGITVGTYSSIFIASPVVVFWNRYKNKANQKETVKKLTKAKVSV
ncbi:MAG: protein translocase subunit SecF [bacterium]